MINIFPDPMLCKLLETTSPGIEPETPAKINHVIVNHGHTILKNRKSPLILNASANSFLVETNVHFQTDLFLLWDANRCAIRLTMQLCNDLGMTDWQQGKYQQRKLKQSIRVVSKLRHSTSQDESIKEKEQKEIDQAYRNCLNIASRQVDKVRFTLDSIHATNPMIYFRMNPIKDYLIHSDRQIDQIRRRALQGETIPHEEKVFSIFQPQTEWISKGIAGVPVELGVKVYIIKDQYGFILHSRIMENETDNQIAITIIKVTKENFPSLYSCNFDKGFHCK